MGDYFDAVADAAALPRPPRQSAAEVKAGVSPAMWSFMNESRRSWTTAAAQRTAGQAALSHRGVGLADLVRPMHPPVEQTPSPSRIAQSDRRSAHCRRHPPGRLTQPRAVPRTADDTQRQQQEHHPASRSSQTPACGRRLRASPTMPAKQAIRQNTTAAWTMKTTPSSSICAIGLARPRIDELRQEHQEEQGDLGIEHIGQDALAKIRQQRHSGWLPAPIENLPRLRSACTPATSGRPRPASLTASKAIGRRAQQGGDPSTASAGVEQAARRETERRGQSPRPRPWLSARASTCRLSGPGATVIGDRRRENRSRLGEHRVSFLRGSDDQFFLMISLMRFFSSTSTTTGLWVSASSSVIGP